MNRQQHQHHVRRAHMTDRRIQRGERVVVIDHVTADQITIHGFGTYDHASVQEHPEHVVRSMANAIAAADAVAADLTPLVDHLYRKASPEWREQAHRRLKATRAKGDAASVETRARAMLARVDHEPRVRLDDGRILDAGNSMVMRAEAFGRYAADVRVTKLGAGTAA